VTAEEYVCANCHGTFEKAWTDEEALAEYEAAFTEEERADVREVVCDDCYTLIMADKIELERRLR
jgi:DNA-directed RNA polymerase subunit RPC12/RpoP